MRRARSEQQHCRGHPVHCSGSPDGTPGLQAQYFSNRKLDFSGTSLQSRVEDGASINGSPPGITDLPADYAYSVRWRGVFTAATGGSQRFSINGCGTGRLLIDGKIVAEFQRVDFGTIEHAVIDMRAGKSASIEVQWTPGQGAPGPAMHILGTTLGSVFELGFAGPDSLMNEAVAAARVADVAIVFASDRMGEGADRAHLALPGDQNALIRAVARANPHTVVVLNTGAAVMMPWRNEVAAVLELWYPGDALGAASADLLFGDTEPSGRLPLTFPADESQGPGATPETYPGQLDQAGMLATVSYSEGSDVGYRYFEQHHQRPLYPFGFGLSYTAFRWTQMHVARDAGGAATVTATLQNVGRRPGTDTVEVYVIAPSERGTQNPKQLNGLANANLAVGASRTLQIKLDADAFSRWDPTDHAWRKIPGQWRIMIGRSSDDIVYRQTLQIPAR